MNDSMILNGSRTANPALLMQESVREYYGRTLSTSADLQRLV